MQYMGVQYATMDLVFACDTRGTTAAPRGDIEAVLFRAPHEIDFNKLPSAPGARRSVFPIEISDSCIDAVAPGDDDHKLGRGARTACESRSFATLRRLQPLSGEDGGWCYGGLNDNYCGL
jgi:hypothetical protein